LGGLPPRSPLFDPLPSPLRSLSSSLRAASRAARYSRTACDASSLFGQAIGWPPESRFFLSTSALIRLASIENASPPTSPVAMHIATTEYRVIGDPVLNTELAEPPVGQVDLDFSAQPALRAERKHVANDQHPDHQYRINRGPTRVRVIRRQLLVHPTQIEKTVDLPYQMIGRNYFVEIKRIEKLSLSFFPPPHHAPLPPMPSPPTESWFAIRIKGSFATQSEGKETRFELFCRRCEASEIHIRCRGKIGEGRPHGDRLAELLRIDLVERVVCGVMGVEIIQSVLAQRYYGYAGFLKL